MKSPSLILFQFNSGMILKVYICCIRHRPTRAVKRNFTKDSVQQPGTYVQQAHTSKSVKGRSRAATKKRVADDIDVIPNTSFSRSANRSKCSTPRPLTKEDVCPFAVSVFVIQEIKNGIYLVVPQD